MTEEQRHNDTTFRITCLQLAFAPDGTKDQQLENAKKFYDWIVPDSRRDTNVIQFRPKSS